MSRGALRIDKISGPPMLHGWGLGSLGPFLSSARVLSCAKEIKQRRRETLAPRRGPSAGQRFPTRAIHDRPHPDDFKTRLNGLSSTAFPSPERPWHLGNVMKTITSLACGLACAVGASLGVASVTSVVEGSDSSPSMTMEGSDLWTSAPVKINRSAQTFERIPALLSTYASAPVRTAGTKSPEEREVVAPMSPAPSAVPLSADHLSWCASRYRSFNPATDSYRSFSGEVRTCSPPLGITAPVSSYSKGQAARSSFVEERVATWCASRYRSYRPEDNTYQPHVGQRRVCKGPRAGDETALR